MALLLNRTLSKQRANKNFIKKHIQLTMISTTLTKNCTERAILGLNNVIDNYHFEEKARLLNHTLSKQQANKNWIKKRIN